VHTREIHGFKDVALRGGAVTEQTYGNAGLLAQLKGVGDACSVRGLRSDGNAEREILDWPGEVIAALSRPVRCNATAFRSKARTSTIAR
jgi:hypothetical protein